jgi:DNA-binding transcriptional MerR regulator
MRIGQVARQTGVSVQTIRLYDSRGLIGGAERLPSGYRDYPPSALDDVRAVRQGQRLGFTLGEMQAFMALQQSPTRTHVALAQFIAEKRAQLDARIAQMTAFRDALDHLASADYDWNAAGDCPITRLLAAAYTASQAEVMP